MKNRIPLCPLFLIAALLVLSCCTTNPVVMTEWVNPDYQTRAIRKILLIGIGNEKVSREEIEKNLHDKLANQDLSIITGSDVIPDKAQLNQRTIEIQASRNKADAILIAQAADLALHAHPLRSTSRSLRVGTRFDKPTTVESIYIDSQYSDLVDDRFFMAQKRSQKDHSSRHIAESHLYFYSRLITPGDNNPIWLLQTDFTNPKEIDAAMKEISSTIANHLKSKKIIP